MAWAYIVECADVFFDVGSTVDLDRRISEHNDGLGRGLHEATWAAAR